MPVNYFKNAKSWQPLLFVILLLAVIILLKFSGVADKLTDVREWINGLGFWAPVVFVLFYILAVILALPGSAITIAGATLFGSFWGVVLVSIASVIGASICFLISRYLARDLILRKLAQNEKFLKLDRMAEEHGAIFVAITRLVPIFPFNVLNYGFGLTGVRFRTYVFHGHGYVCCQEQFYMSLALTLFYVEYQKVRFPGCWFQFFCLPQLSWLFLYLGPERSCPSKITKI